MLTGLWEATSTASPSSASGRADATKVAGRVDAAANFGIATGAFVHEREDWDAAVAKAVFGRWRFVELTAITEERLDSLVDFLQQEGQGALEAFERVSIHAPVMVRTSVTVVAQTLAMLGRCFDVIVHPDLYGGERSLLRVGRRVVFENMDIEKSFGQGVADLGSVFDAHPDAGFCLDVAHAWTNDPSLQLAHDLIDSFSHRLRQLHVSGIEPDGTHRPTTDADLDLYAPVLTRCEHVPWLLEAELVRSSPLV